MSPLNCHREGAERLQVAAVDKVQLAVDGRSLCGRVTVDELDVYSDEVGLLAWNDGPLEPYRSGLLLTHPRPLAEDSPSDLVGRAGPHGAVTAVRTCWGWR